MHGPNSNSKIENEPKLRLKGTQDSFLKETAATDQKDVSPRPKTRLSKLLSKSLSSEKSQSSAGKEDDRASDDPSTVVSSKQKVGGAEFLKDFRGPSTVVSSKQKVGDAEFLKDFRDDRGKRNKPLYHR